MKLIHKFIKNGVPIVLDVNSGSVHVVDMLVYEILDWYPELKAGDIELKLENKYSREKIREALEEIKHLESIGQLFSEDIYDGLTASRFGKNVIKALCLHVAHDCNIRCEYCFASQGDFNSGRLLMDVEVARKAVDFLIKHSGKRKNIEIDFFGGEPLLNFTVVKETVDYGNRMASDAGKNLKFTITTNAVLLNEKIIDYINKNMSNVVLSLDGNRETNDRMRHFDDGSGTYDIVSENIKSFIAERGEKSYYVRGTFTRYNADFSKDVLHLADMGCKSLSVEPVVSEKDKSYAIREEDLANILSEYDILFSECMERMGTDREFDFYHFKINLDQGPCAVKRLTGCGAGYQYLAVTPEGDLYPCHQFVGDSRFIIGNVFDGIINAEIPETFKAAHVYNKPGCRNCWAKFYCSGGCHANSYKLTGDINSCYEVGCEMEKKRLECAIALQVIKKLKEEKNDQEVS
ncbi:MAG: SCIFF radical SAM maturase [Firmicutes bacterium]|nr:SCIFF radical SAM maturase [Bacillota bacterium]MDI6706627.1 thioether cross-link-forming SCIFF peptide maturase [Bacillota bacterium]